MPINPGAARPCGRDRRSREDGDHHRRRLRKSPPGCGRGAADVVASSAGASSENRSPPTSSESKRSISANPARSRREYRPLRALRSLSLRARMTTPAKGLAPARDSNLYFNPKRSRRHCKTLSNMPNSAPSKAVGINHLAISDPTRGVRLPCKKRPGCYDVKRASCVTKT